MKVLLTQPFKGYVEEPPEIPDLGLGYLATQLLKIDMEVYVRDWNVESSVADFEKWLLERQPDAVGIKVFTKDVKAAIRTIAMVRKALPDAVVVIGGPHASCSEPSDLIRDFPDYDYAIRGEAEYSLPTLLSALGERNGKGKDVSISEKWARRIPGLVWRMDGRIEANPVLFVEDLDSIDFPAWEMLRPDTYSGDIIFPCSKKGATAPIITTRGCPGHCGFCSAYLINGRRIRSRSTENVIEEMKVLYGRYHVRKFMFMDNSFTSHAEGLVNLCHAIIETGMSIAWDCNSYEKLDNLNDETVSLMGKAGCRMVHMGIESGSERIRNGMKKAASLQKYREKIRLLKKHNIGIGAWFMIGFPDETYQDIKKTLQYAFSINAEMVTFTICFPLPGSDVYEFSKDRYNISSIDWSRFNLRSSPYPMSRLSSRKLSFLLRTIRFGLRLGAWLKRLRAVDVSANEGSKKPVAIHCNRG